MFMRFSFIFSSSLYACRIRKNSTKPCCGSGSESFWKADPDPHQSEKPASDLDLHLNETPGALEAHNGAMETHPGTVNDHPFSL